MHTSLRPRAGKSYSNLGTRGYQDYGFPTEYISENGIVFVGWSETCTKNSLDCHPPRGTNPKALHASTVGAKIWNGTPPPQLRELGKAPFKRKMNNLLL